MLILQGKLDTPSQVKEYENDMCLTERKISFIENRCSCFIKSPISYVDLI